MIISGGCSHSRRWHIRLSVGKRFFLDANVFNDVKMLDDAGISNDSCERHKALLIDSRRSTREVEFWLR